jgi:hypothetical protein
MERDRLRLFLYLDLSCLPPWRVVSTFVLRRAVEVQGHVWLPRLNTIYTITLLIFPIHPPVC